jgi:heme-degrading monooxygenase HmoA
MPIVGRVGETSFVRRIASSYNPVSAEVPVTSPNLSPILRIWHGRTSRERADAYARFLLERAVPDYRSVPGNLDVAVVRRDDGYVTHFLTVTRWQDEAAIRAFAGEDLLQAKYYPEDREFLLEFEPRVEHYEIVGGESAGAVPFRALPPTSD